MTPDYNYGDEIELHWNFELLGMATLLLKWDRTQAYNNYYFLKFVEKV